jgi:hypothetical protein
VEPPAVQASRVACLAERPAERIRVHPSAVPAIKDVIPRVPRWTGEHPPLELIGTHPTEQARQASRQRDRAAAPTRLRRQHHQGAVSAALERSLDSDGRCEGSLEGFLLHDVVDPIIGGRA